MVEISFAKQQLRGKEKVMNAKHLTKNAMSHKLVFLAVGLALAIIAVFSICTTSQAKADESDKWEHKLMLYGSGK